MKKIIGIAKNEQYFDSCKQEIRTHWSSDYPWYCCGLINEEWKPEYSRNGDTIRAGVRGWYKSEKEAQNMCDYLNSKSSKKKITDYVMENGIPVYNEFDSSHPFYIWKSIGEKYWHDGRSYHGEYPKCNYKGWFASIKDADKMVAIYNNREDHDTDMGGTVITNHELNEISDNILEIDTSSMTEEEAIAKIREEYKSKKSWLQKFCDENEYDNIVDHARIIADAAIAEYLRRQGILVNTKTLTEMGLNE